MTVVTLDDTGPITLNADLPFQQGSFSSAFSQEFNIQSSLLLAILACCGEDVTGSGTPSDPMIGNDLLCACCCDEEEEFWATPVEQGTPVFKIRPHNQKRSFVF